jgi:NADPH:quinone reductase-like Zn-dependent oxidoreductase
MLPQSRGFQLPDVTVFRPARSNASQLGAQLVAEGKLSVPIAATYPLSSAPAALAPAQKGRKLLSKFS